MLSYLHRLGLKRFPCFYLDRFTFPSMWNEERQREGISRAPRFENILLLLCLGTGKAQTSLSSRRLETEHAITKTLISELVFPYCRHWPSLRKSLTWTESELIAKQILRWNFHQKQGNQRGNRALAWAMDRENCCKVLFHQLLIFGCLTDSAEEIVLLEMDILLI